MPKRVLLIAIIIFVSPVVSLCDTPTVNTAYTYDYSQPPEFQPSMTSQFSTLANGVTDIYANPAGIMHVNTLEVAIGVSGYVQNPIRSDQNTLYVQDTDLGGIQNSPNSKASVSLSNDRNILTPEARPITVDEQYSKGGGINYLGMTYRVADWLAFSITRKRPTVFSFNYNAMVPVGMNAQSNFRGTSVEANGTGVQVRSDGTIEVVFMGAAIATSDAPAFSGFLDQGTSEVNDLNATFNNSISDQNSIVITAATKTGPVSWGLNVMPETVDIQMDNEINVTSASDNTNPTIALPNFGTSSEDVVSWVTHECTVAGGYHIVSVESLPGQQIGAAKVAGKYSGSFVRMDLGMMWEPLDFLTVGAVYENFNGAELKLEGINVEQYVEHRLDTTSRMPTDESATYWDPYLATPTHEADVEQTIKNILTFQPIEIPKKLRFGIALKKPIIVALDWEQWQNEYKYTSDPANPDTAHYITLSNISFLKLGAESQILFLPAVIRGSITGIFKPTTDDPATQKSLDDLFSSTPIVPVDGNIYLGFGVLDGEFGLGVGGGGLPLINALMFDVSNIAKVFYTNVYYKKGDWQVNYLMTMDPVLTGFSSDVSTTQGQDSKINLMSTSTLSLGFRF